MRLQLDKETDEEETEEKYIKWGCYQGNLHKYFPWNSFFLLRIFVAAVAVATVICSLFAASSNFMYLVFFFFSYF